MSKAINKKAVGTQAMLALKIGGGIMAGNVVGGFLDKTLKVDATSKLPKKLLGPLVMVGLGAVIAIKAKDPNAKSVATGIAVAGVMRGAKAVMPNAGLAGELGYLGSMSPMAAVANAESWVRRDALSGQLHYPDLGALIQPASHTGGYGVDAPGFMFGAGDESYIAGDDEGYVAGLVGGPEDNDIL